jgi:pyruvate dehydrogenase kinase 2/3/4
MHIYLFEQKTIQVVIKISDEGGGIRRSHMPRIWSYLYTTADPSILDRMLGSSIEARDFGTSSPLAGLGYGLPISRNYARFFGGDLSILSMEGYGTDSFIHLPRLGDRETAVV